MRNNVEIAVVANRLLLHASNRALCRPLGGIKFTRAFPHDHSRAIRYGRETVRQNGLLVGKGGLCGNVLRLAPMLNTSKSDVDKATRLLDKSFSEVRS